MKIDREWNKIQMKWLQEEAERKTRGAISRTIFLYCIAFFVLSFVFIWNDNALHCVLTLYDPKWMACIHIYTQKGVFKWLILHFYSISFRLRANTPNLARFIVYALLSFFCWLPCFARFGTIISCKRMSNGSVWGCCCGCSCCCTKPSACYSCSVQYCFRNRFLFWDRTMIWYMVLGSYSYPFPFPVWCENGFAVCIFSSGFSGAAEWNVYTSSNGITHEKFVVCVFLSIAFVVVVVVVTLPLFILRYQRHYCVISVWLLCILMVLMVMVVLVSFCRNDTTCQVWFIVNLFELAFGFTLPFHSVLTSCASCVCANLRVSENASVELSYTRDNEDTYSHTSTVSQRMIRHKWRRQKRENRATKKSTWDVKRQQQLGCK